MSLIDQGNEIFRAKNFSKAKELYEKWLYDVYYNDKSNTTLTKDAIRCFTNLSLCDLNLQNYQGAVNSISKVLELDKTNKKAYTILEQALYNSGKVDSFLDACKMEAQMLNNSDDIFSLPVQNPQHIMHSIPSMIDLNTLLNLANDQVREYAKVRNKKFLGTITRKEFHDSWELHNYFDENTEDKYVQCPPEKFFIPSKSENPSDEEKKLSEKFFWIFAYSFQRFHGLPNYIFSKLFLAKYLEVVKDAKTMEQAPPIILWIDQRRRVAHLSLVFGHTRGTSINFVAESGDRGAISRDMDPHVWIEIELLPKDALEPASNPLDKETICLDLCGLSYNNSQRFGMFKSSEMSARKKNNVGKIVKDFQMGIKEWVNQEEGKVKEYDWKPGLYIPESEEKPLPFFMHEEIDSRMEKFVAENEMINKKQFQKMQQELIDIFKQL